MRIVNSEFKISATNPKQYPQDDLKEIVLVGKSNVGKSSFINTLANRKNLARTSSVPGKTRLINYYKMISKISIDGTEENKDFYFVDLPGYGFSQMSKQEQITVGNFIEEYLSKSKKISLIVFLIDIRHDPTNNDKLMYDYIIKQNIPCVVVCNKADKLAPTKVDLSHSRRGRKSPEPPGETLRRVVFFCEKNTLGSRLRCGNFRQCRKSSDNFR